jgi:hypothetical protein
VAVTAAAAAKVVTAAATVGDQPSSSAYKRLSSTKKPWSPAQTAGSRAFAFEANALAGRFFAFIELNQVVQLIELPFPTTQVVHRMEWMKLALARFR